MENNGSGGEMFIYYKRSDKKLQWNDQYKSILEFSEDNNIEIDSGCHFGDCGTCLTKLIEGGVRYTHTTLVDPGDRYCLPCSCVPVSDIVLDA